MVREELLGSGAYAEYDVTSRLRVDRTVKGSLFLLGLQHAGDFNPHCEGFDREIDQMNRE